MYNATNYALVADDITYFIMCAMISTAPLLSSVHLLLDTKKCPPSLLYVLVSFRYPALLCTANNIFWLCKLGLLPLALLSNQVVCLYVPSFPLLVVLAMMLLHLLL